MNTRLWGVIAVLALGMTLMFNVAAGSRPPASGDELPGRYVVLLKAGASADDVARGHGLGLEHRFSSINGASLVGAPGKLRNLQADPRVAIAEPDRVVSLGPPSNSAKPGGSGSTQPPQSVPTGINRIDADLSAAAKIDGVDERVNVGIAIIDTGIQPDHPDLYVVGGKNCSDGKSWKDGHGHGTHVSGTAAALDNTIGVVGVAPGARLWAVRVLNNAGSGSVASVVCGVDWVTNNASTLEVANMSLGCECGSDILDTAISASVTAGVTYAVAAGNSSKDAASFQPANHPDVMAVSAIADFNGVGGSGAAPTCRTDVDDTFADFSNFGSVVDIAAPGVCILSTYKGSKYATMSGTSMASPHVAGAAALYKANNAGATPGDVKSALLASGKDQADLTYGFTGDPDAYSEPLVYAGGL
ncbi:MAG: S8 family peptidase [Chloroflexi bacterium]|nr:S8 family peptidase [Chloroflexota bacterium]